MSCDRNASKVVRFACRLGITRGAGQSAFLTLSAGAVAFAAVAGRKWLRRDRSSPAVVPVTPALPEGYDLPEQAPRPTIEPSSPPSGQTCPGCAAGSDKPGPWYAINDQHHCADCAPEAARKAGFRLAVPVSEKPVLSIENRPTFGPDAPPTPSLTDGAPVDPTRHIISETGASPIVVQRNDGSTLTLRLSGFPVLRKEGSDQAELAITPVIVDVAGEGPKMLRDSWQITHIATGRQVADIVFKTSDDALPLGTLLAQFDCWNKGNDALRREITTILATIESYKQKREAAAAKAKEQAETQ